MFLYQYFSVLYALASLREKCISKRGKVCTNLVQLCSLLLYVLCWPWCSFLA